jgi:hypothetical protein
MQEKVCRICQNSKPISEYYPNKHCKYGVVGTCKICYNPRISQWYADNRKDRQDKANDRNRSRKQEAVDRFGNQCEDCKQSYPNYVYQFHHLDPSQKDVNPSKAMASPTKMWEELAKCVMLCANCHMIRHHRKEAVDETTH